MTKVFSEYVTLLDEIERIPVTARECRNVSVERRAEVIASVVELVRYRVLPQSDRDWAGRAALLDDDGEVDGGGSAGGSDHSAIQAALDELAEADPVNGARVQQLLYRVHAAIAGHFSEAELMVASLADEEIAVPGRRRITGRPRVTVESTGPSAWFG